MSSTDKTEKAGLNQYTGSDNLRRDDYNIDMSKIDSILKQLDETITPTYNGRELIIISNPALKKITLKITQNVTGGSVTIKNNGGAAKPLLLPNGDPVIELLTETTFYVIRVESQAFILAPTGAKLVGDAQPIEVLSGKTFMNKDGEQLGTIPKKSIQTFTPTTVPQSIAAGQYLSGIQTIAGDPDLLSANIKAGKSVFGIPGDSNVVDTADANTTNGQMLVGYSGYASGVKKIGNIPINTGVSQADTNRVTGTVLVLGIPTAGYYSDSAEIYLSDANFKSGNIRSGSTLFGIAGDGNVVDTSDANLANGGHMVEGFSAYADGVKYTGTLLNRWTGVFGGTGPVVNGNELQFGIPTEARYGITAKIARTDNDWIEANIKSGVSIFGKTGTLTLGVKSVTHYSITMTSSNRDENIAISIADVNKAVVKNLSYENSNITDAMQYSRISHTATILSTTLLEVERYGSAAGTTIVHFDLVEYTELAKLVRATITASAKVQSFSLGQTFDLSKSELYRTLRCNQVSYFVDGYKLFATTVEFYMPAVATRTIVYEVIQHK